MRRPGATGAVACLVVTAAIVLAGCSAQPTDALSKLAHLAAGEHPGPALLPPVVKGVDGGIVDSSLRRLTEHDGTSFWVGVTNDDRVCFIAESGDTQAECVEAERFGSRGATLEVGEPGQRFWLHTEYMTVGAGWTSIAPNIAVRD